MSRKKRRRVDGYITELETLGVLEPRQLEAVKRALKGLRRAQRTGNRQAVREALDEIARAFLRVTIEFVDPEPENRTGD